MATSLFVGNLSYSTTESALQQAFSNYGASAARIIEGRGFGFVDVEDGQAAAAVEGMNETELDGRKIYVSEARPKHEGGGDW
ncbi:MAG: RNA-binding protein [Armatimonadetes bacterium]|nr:RNA-binding protein [Armatimonadota bacterium]